jgi:hypothetical protein
VTDLGGAISDPRGTLGVLALAFVFLLYGSVTFAVDGTWIIAHPTSFAALAVVHAFAGFIVLSIVAAAHQLIPVVTGGRTLGAWTALVLAAPIAIGFGLLILSFEGAGSFIPAAILLAIGIAAWSIAMLVRLVWAPRELRMRVALGLAVLALAGAAVIGTLMALAFGGSATTWSLKFAPAHAMLALVGFVSATIVIVSYRLVPMFALAHTGNGTARFAPALLMTPLAMLAAFVWLDARWLFRIVLIAMLAVFAAFVVIQTSTIRHRLRRRLDVSLRYAMVTWSFAILALLAASAGAFLPSLSATAVLLALLGWIIPSILGYAYKIVGFLAWQRARERFPVTELEPLSGVVNYRLTTVALVALALGTFGCAAAPLFGQLVVAISPVLYCAGVLLSLAALIQIISRYRRPLCKASSTVVGSIHPSRLSEFSP